MFSDTLKVKLKDQKEKSIPWKGITFGKIQFEVAAKLKMLANNYFFIRSSILTLPFRCVYKLPS